jgi:hypothetical protein
MTLFPLRSPTVHRLTDQRGHSSGIHAIATADSPDALFIVPDSVPITNPMQGQRKSEISGTSTSVITWTYFLSVQKTSA